MSSLVTRKELYSTIYRKSITREKLKANTRTCTSYIHIQITGFEFEDSCALEQSDDVARACVAQELEAGVVGGAEAAARARAEALASGGDTRAAAEQVEPEDLGDSERVHVEVLDALPEELLGQLGRERHLAQQLRLLGRGHHARHQRLAALLRPLLRAAAARLCTRSAYEYSTHSNGIYRTVVVMRSCSYARCHLTFLAYRGCRRLVAERVGFGES